MARPIVKQVIDHIKGGDESNINLFFDIVERDLDVQKRNAEKKLADKKYAVENKLVDLAIELDEAKGDYKNAILAVDAEQVKTGDARKAYLSVYKDKVETAASLVVTIEKEIENQKESLEKTTKEITEALNIIAKTTKELQLK